MNSWLDHRAFVIATALMAVAQFDRLSKSGFAAEQIPLAILVCVVGGLFWGAVGTYLYRRFRKEKKGASS